MFGSSINNRVDLGRSNDRVSLEESEGSLEGSEGSLEDRTVTKADGSKWKNLFIALVILGVIGLVIAGIGSTSLYAQHHQLSNVFAAIPSPWPIVMTVVGGALVIGGIIGVVGLLKTRAQPVMTNEITETEGEENQEPDYADEVKRRLAPDTCTYIPATNNPDMFYFFWKKGGTLGDPSDVGMKLVSEKGATKSVNSLKSIYRFVPFHVEKQQSEESAKEAILEVLRQDEVTLKKGLPRGHCTYVPYDTDPRLCTLYTMDQRGYFTIQTSTSEQAANEVEQLYLNGDFKFLFCQREEGTLKLYKSGVLFTPDMVDE